MKILADPSIRRLFVELAGAAAAFMILAGMAALFFPAGAVLWVWLAALCMAGVMAAALWQYFQKQNRVMEQAVSVISEWTTGDGDARIPCDEEGELNRLFQEVNALAAILNAHTEQEGKSRQFLKETLSDISHQLKTPLAALNIYNGILQQEPVDPETVKEFTSLSEQELDRIQRLVQDLLTIARLDAGTMAWEKRTFPVSWLMEQVGRRFAFQARQQEKNLSFSGGEEITLYGDPHWLNEAVSNLVKNALEHTRPGDAIHVSWSTFGSVVQIQVRDNGSGIHPEDLPYIFKRFYRSRFSQDTQGVGLGLPLAKAIVEAHSGTIEAESEPGEGTLFTLDFLIPTKL